jgi:galactokinase/mevalonate kinase-like predicted kinase
MDSWDYLVVTASNAEQAAAYESQLAIRLELGLLHGVGQVLVVADPGGRRVGSGGSTIHCLVTVLNRERNGMASLDADWMRSTLGRLRVLIIHAGGDSKRLPTYGPCGKIFVPVPGDSDCALTPTLFDRQLPVYLALPKPEGGCGQTVITSGDVLLGFDPTLVSFADQGTTGLGCHAAPEQAARHGVFCPDGDRVRRFLQKPSPDAQREQGAVDRYGRSVLDIGVMSFDGGTAMRLLDLCGVRTAEDGTLAWHGPVADAVLGHGLDFYREISCALGVDTSASDYITEVRASGCSLDQQLLEQVHNALHGIPFHVQVLPKCSFLHFGTLRQLVSSGLDLLREDRGMTDLREVLSITNTVSESGGIAGTRSWVEACVVNAPLTLPGGNVLAGLDIDEPLSLPEDACLDVLEGRNRDGDQVWFVRLYDAGDDFKGNTLWGQSLDQIVSLSGATAEDIWDSSLRLAERGVWNARMFPALTEPSGYRRWLWLFAPKTATAEQWRQWLEADRYSLAETALLTDQAAFHARRMRLRAIQALDTLPRLFRPDSGFSAAELDHVLAHAPSDTAMLPALVRELARHELAWGGNAGVGAVELARLAHTIATALEYRTAQAPGFGSTLPAQAALLDVNEQVWLEMAGLRLDTQDVAAAWPVKAKAFAFAQIGEAVASGSIQVHKLPTNTLRKDEIVWGRAPARLDLAGGWSDTPPYTLEEGGCVLNAAVDLNGQPPIQAYARVIDEPVIRLASIDFGGRLEITELEQLLDYRTPGGGFSLPKAALALSGFDPTIAPWPQGITLRGMLEQFGGGIELTTLAAIPGGSGLGTSSIMGAVIHAVIQRVLGNTLAPRELFHAVLRLEQALTTGGGWQDQIGGIVPGAKIITTGPGLVPDPSIHFVPADVLTPLSRGGSALLYYTGITRLAKNILQNVVGNWLDRDRAAVATLRAIHAFPARTADAMARKDDAAFGRALNAAWTLKKQLDPGSTTLEIDALIDSVRPHLHGAKIMGAGGGGFILMLAKSPQSAQAIADQLTQSPPNPRARVFDFQLSSQGLVVTVC